MTSPNHLSLQSILDQIDAALAKSNTFLKTIRHVNGSDEYSSVEAQETITGIAATVDRLAPVNSHYTRELEIALQNRWSTSYLIEKMMGILKALRNDYDAGYMKSLQELIHADLFSDFLEMASYFLEQGFKDPAAVMAGGVLEEHLRKLCLKHSVAIVDVKPNGNAPKKAERMNADLAGQNIYGKGDQKSITAWLDLRNNAAHGKYANYTNEQVSLMVQSIQDFLNRNPA